MVLLPFVAASMLPTSLSAPNDPKPKSRFWESSPSPVSQCPIFRTFAGATGEGRAAGACVAAVALGETGTESSTDATVGITLIAGFGDEGTSKGVCGAAGAGGCEGCFQADPPVTETGRPLSNFGSVAAGAGGCGTGAEVSVSADFWG